MSFILCLICSACSSKQTSPDVTNQEVMATASISTNTNEHHFICDSLSQSFDFEVQIKQPLTDDPDDQSKEITLKILDKTSHKILDSIQLHAQYLFSEVLTDCSNTRSYSTGKNAKKEIEDNDYGDLVIGDLNFDQKEDIALIKDSGGNGGPIYAFYLQGVNHHFVYDNFLTDSVGTYPTLDIKTKTLTTDIHASAMSFMENIFQYDNQSKAWKRLSSIEKKVD